MRAEVSVLCLNQACRQTYTQRLVWSWMPGGARFFPPAICGACGSPIQLTELRVQTEELAR